ncbi:O-acetylhomoserine sulfhydrylase [Bacteroidia bacterium]|nr:O-acetylhomoserine sulfhydrylase [Bacteroidia bacterium]
MFSTRIINNKFAQPDVYGAINMPVYRTAAFEYPDSESIAAAFQYRYDQHTYSRISNPTVQHFEAKIKAAAGAESVIALASGMAAISGTFLTIARTGDNIVASPHLFGNTFSFLRNTLADFGIEVRFVNTDRLDEIAAAIDDNSCAFFTEIITNPNLEIANLPEISNILKERHVPMIVDTTLIPWCGFDARACGIDIEVASTTKFVSGGASSTGGVIADYGTFDWRNSRKLAQTPKPKGMSRFMFRLRSEIARNLGACLSPDNAFLQAAGMETLALRFLRMSETAYRLAQHLSSNPNIVRVNYPELDSSPYKTLSDRLFTGHPGAMLTISLADKAACYRFIDKLKVIRRATNLFDNKSLAIHPESTIYGTFNPEWKAIAGVDPTLIRISTGLEDTADLIEDIEQAL